MRFWGILVGVLGILGILGFVVLNNLHAGETLSASQKQKALTNLLGRAPITTPVDHSFWKIYSSHFVSFQYPSWATIYTKDNADATKLSNILDSFHFGLLDEHIEGIVSIANRPGFAQVNDEPGVTVRLQNKDYQEIGTRLGNMVEFVKTKDTLERSVFIFKNGRLYSLIVSGGTDGENKNVFEKMKDSMNPK